ncbi:hypothetical protein GGX14DRAFT_397541 [Mycena pura]|uniref:Hydrophobin n=1 Tax=Mycena pura TaxID=153505 RepID=A0AAD6V7X7_9AGAR|nr:hypothetical protein GGX14DRAFT_397541 [Mycena pura]
MMFPKLSLLATSLMVYTQTLAVANYPAPPPNTANQCCAFVSTSSNIVISTLATLLGASLTGVLNNIGFGCTAINILSNECSATAVNCDSTQIGTGGLINIGCIPITI